MNWNKLWEGIPYRLLCGREKRRILDVCCHSQKAAPQTVFVCIRGTKTDAFAYVQEAYQNGCRVFVTDRPACLERLSDQQKKGCTVVLTADCRETYALLCRNLFGRADEKLILVGVTGTKGKTTTTCLLEKMLQKAGYVTGVIGTCGARWNKTERTLLHTTPDSYVLHGILRDMLRDGVTHVLMEVSSQALMMKRTAGITFETAVFTNLSSDHIGEGEHASIQEYFYWKSRLFSQCRQAVLPCSGEYAASLYAEVVKKGIPCYTAGIKEEDAADAFGADTARSLYAEDVEALIQNRTPAVRFGLRDPQSGKRLRVTLGMTGRFNVRNLLAAFAVCESLGIPVKDVKDACRSVRIPGRMELVRSGNGICVYVDYAHNEESLRTCLTALREYETGRLICVFGCGGNRSKLRRYQMGEVSGRLADLTVVTEDNSRWEAAEDIMEDICTGLRKTDGACLVIPDRRAAIRRALAEAGPGDMVVVAGKGHETYMEKEGVRTFFSDAEEIKAAWKERWQNTQML